MGRVHVSLPSLIHGVSELSASERQPVHALACDNVWIPVQHGSQKRPPLIHVAKIQATTFGDCYCHAIDRGSGERYISLFKFGATTANGIVFDTAGAVYVVKMNTGTYAAPDYSTTCTYPYLASGSSPSQTIRALSVLDYTFLSNRNTAVTMANTTSAASPTNTAHIAVNQGAFAMTYTVKIQNGTGTVYSLNAITAELIGPANVQISVADGVPVHDLSYPTPASGTSSRTSIKTQDIADRLMQALNGATPSTTYGTNVAVAGPPAEFTVTRNGHVLKIIANTGGGLPVANTGVITVLEVKTSQGNGLAVGFQNETERFQDLPLIFTHNYVMKVKGNSLNDEDDFWVKFTSETASASLSEGTWAEDLKPGSTYTWPTVLSQSNHPHALVRRTSSEAGTATNPVVGNSGKYFTFEPINLDDREVGDTVNNEDPSFISRTGTYNPVGGGGTSSIFPVVRKVQSICFFRDRLIFSCDESVSCSEQGSYFNFFRTTIQQLLDSDPIDVQVNSNRSSIIHSMVPFNSKLMLFSADAQAQLFGSPNLTPATVEASVVSHYQSTSECSPIAYEDGILFPSITGSFSGLRSLMPTPNTESSFSALDLGIHVPTYIPGRVKQITVTPDSSIVALFTDGDPDAIYVLKQHREGSQIIQSAWVRQIIEGATIRGIHFFDSKLYVVTEHTSISVAVTYTAVAAGYKYGLALKSDGSVVSWGLLNSPVGSSGQGNVPSFGGLTATAIACASPNSSGASGHSLALMNNGTIIAWGFNTSGQCNVTALPGGVTYTAMAGGLNHSIALRSNGTAIGWGASSSGEIAVPTLPGGMTYTAVAAGHRFSAFLRSDGNIVTCGHNGVLSGSLMISNVPALPVGVTYTAIAAGGRFAIALRSDNAVVAWGSPTIASPNQETNVPSFGGLTPVEIACGEFHASALMNDGTIVTWGLSTVITEPTLPGGMTYTQMAGGANHALALRSDGVIIGWGGNDQGQASPPAPFGASATVGLYLSYFDLSPGVSDGGRDYWLTLDRRVTEATTGVSIAVAGSITTITMPYDMEPGAFMEVVRTDANVRYQGTVTGLNTFTVNVVLTGISFVAGKRYTSSHAFHKPQVMVDARTGKKLVLDSTSAVVSLAVRYEDTDYFKLIANGYEKTIGDQGFLVLGAASTLPVDPESGTVVVGVGGRLDSQVAVRIDNDSPFPHTIVSAEWLMNATIRSAPL